MTNFFTIQANIDATIFQWLFFVLRKERKESSSYSLMPNKQLSAMSDIFRHRKMTILKQYWQQTGWQIKDLRNYLQQFRLLVIRSYCEEAWTTSFYQVRIRTVDQVIPSEPPRILSEWSAFAGNDRQRKCGWVLFQIRCLFSTWWIQQGSRGKVVESLTRARWSTLGFLTDKAGKTPCRGRAIQYFRFSCRAHKEERCFL